MKKIPQRTCMGCNEKKDKDKLIRIVKNKDDEIHIDRNGKMAGRGAYICSNKDCFAKLKKQKLLNKAFKCNVDESVYLDLEEKIAKK